MTKTANKSRRLASRFRQHPLASLREEFDDALDRFFGGEDGWAIGRHVPALDLSETATTVEAKLDLPGIEPNELAIQVNRNSLTVRGERQEEEEEGRTFVRVERRTGEFTRSITLPAEINEDEVVAEYRDGVLCITMPKAETAQARTVRVSRPARGHAE